MSKTLSEQVAELEPSRRGKVIKPEDLQVGDVVDIHGPSTRVVWEDVKVSHVKPRQVRFQGDGLAFEPSFWATYEFRLVRRLEPEPPTEPGSVVLVTEWKGRELDQPIQAMLDESGMWTGVGQFPDRFYVTNPCEITGWKPARIVVEDGE